MQVRFDMIDDTLLDGIRVASDRLAEVDSAELRDVFRFVGSVMGAFDRAVAGAGLSDAEWEVILDRSGMRVLDERARMLASLLGDTVLESGAYAADLEAQLLEKYAVS